MPIAESQRINASPSPRLTLEPTSSRTTVPDGGWWPQSSDAGVELMSLITTLAG